MNLQAKRLVVCDSQIEKTRMFNKKPSQDDPLGNLLPENKLIARNAALNLAGQLVPLLAAIIAIPVIVKVLNTDRFGILALIWVVINYLSLFDFGLGRALTQIIAEKTGLEKKEEIPYIITTALALLFWLGIASVIGSYMLGPLLVTKVLEIPVEFRTETLNSLYILALSIPFIISSVALRGILEANQRFDLLNFVRMPTGVFAFIGPLLVLPLTTKLTGLALVLCVGQVVSWLGYLVACFRIVPEMKVKFLWKKKFASSLIRLGGWMTLSNLLSPLMVYLDRFFIASIVSLSAVGFYSAPFEVVTKLWLIPGALLRVQFPLFTETRIKSEERTLHLFRYGMRGIFLFVFPSALLIIVFGREGLHLWLGAEFASRSTTAMQLLAIGVFMNCLAQVPFAFIQACGRPDITGKIHLAELPAYFLVIWLLIKAYGIAGAAMACALRLIVDLVILIIVSRRIFPSLSKVGDETYLYLVFAVVAFIPALAIKGLGQKIAFVAFVLLFYAFLARKILKRNFQRWIPVSLE